jgi:hypothetical protein
MKLNQQKMIQEVWANPIITCVIKISQRSRFKIKKNLINRRHYD